MGFFFWKKKQEPQNTEGETANPQSDSAPRSAPEKKDRKTRKAEKYFNKGLEYLESESNKEKAFQQFVNAGNLGYIDAIHYIGLCYFKGYGTPMDQKRAVGIWKKDVLKTNPHTQYMLGYCYHYGIGLDKDRIVARAYLKKAEELGSTDASQLLKETIQPQASYTSANYHPPVTPTESQSSASSTPTYEPGFLKITAVDDGYVIKFENARATVLKQKEGYFFSSDSTIKQQSQGVCSEVQQRRGTWNFANLLSPGEPDLLVLRYGQNSRLHSISQVVELISGKKINGIPDETTLKLKKVWTNEDKTTETAREQAKVQKSGEKVTETDLPTEYAEYQNVTDEYARGVFFLVESLITDNPIKGKYFHAGREILVRLAKSAKGLMNSLPDNDRYQFLYSEINLPTSQNILASLSPESRYQIFFAGANCGGIRAKTELGKCYRDGIGVKADAKKAEFWFISAAQRGNEEAKTLLRQLKPSPSKPASQETSGSRPSPSKPTPQETSGSQPSASPLPEFDSSLVLFEEADILYKHALAYYVGDIKNRTNITKYMNYLRIAEELGSKQAAFLLKTEESFYYTHLEAARYGSKKAEGQIRYIISSGKIPSHILIQYVRYISARTPSDDYYKFSNTSPDIVQKVYQRGLSYWVGDVYPWTDGTKGNEYLRVARDLGSQDAEFILNSEHKKLYIYLEAAKYGSLKAKQQVREWNSKEIFFGKIPDETLKEYLSGGGILPDEKPGKYFGETDSVTGKDETTVARQPPSRPLPGFDLSFVLFEEADILYKHALAYYVGDITGRTNTTKYHEYLDLARRCGSKQAAFLLNTREGYYYTYLEAARYGSAKAKEHIQYFDLKKGIPDSIADQYLRYIKARPDSRDYHHLNNSPSAELAQKIYQIALRYYTGDETGRVNISKSIEYLVLARDQGSPDAKFLLESPHRSLYIYLEAAKYGSDSAKQRIIALNNSNSYDGKVPDAKLREYFQTLGLPIERFWTADEYYRGGLVCSVNNDDSSESINKTISYFIHAKNKGSEDAKKILDSEYTWEYAYLEAAVYGIEGAKDKVIECDRNGDFDGKIPQEILEEYFRKLGIKSVLTENPLEHYKKGLSYYVGKADKETALEHLNIARRCGLEDAKFLLNTKHQALYVWLEAAKHGIEGAKEQVTEYDEKGTFDGKIPLETQKTYFAEIGIQSVITDDPLEHYRKGLRYYIGEETGKTDEETALLHLNIARRCELEDAKTLFTRKHREYYIWLEAAKHGSEKAKEQVIEYYKTGLFGEKIPWETLIQYFREIGIESVIINNRLEYYKKGLSYYIGDGIKADRTKALEHFNIAEKCGLEDARFLLNAEDQELYVWLEAAKYGSNMAKRQVRESDRKGTFDEKIPREIQKKYFAEIGLESVLDENPWNHYQKGLRSYIGVKGEPDKEKALDHFNIARRCGLEEAEFLLNTEHQELYVWLEAAKYGREKAKEQVKEDDRKGTFDGKISREIQKKYFAEIGIESVLDENPLNHYKKGLDYYIGDKEEADREKALEYFHIAKRCGLEDAGFLLNTEQQEYYIWLEAAKYGREKAKEQVKEYDRKGTFDGKIPREIQKKYFAEIGIESVLDENPLNHYKKGLDYYIGDKEEADREKALEYFNIAQRCGLEDAGFLLNTEQQEYYIWLEAAKHGSEKAKEQVIEYYKSRTFGEKIPRETLIQYFREIGIESVITNDPLENYKKGLSYYIGEVIKADKGKALEHITIAEKGGLEDARFLLNTQYRTLYIWLEAAKYGSSKAKRMVKEYDRMGTFDGKIPLETQKKYFAEIGIKSVLDENPLENYKKGLEYYIGDKTRVDKETALEYFNIARRGGLKEAEFLLNTEHQNLYIWLEAAKYGSSKAKRKVKEYDQKGTFDEKIPLETQKKYLAEIGILSVIFLNPDELYKQGLAYYAGDKVTADRDTALGLFRIAKRCGQEDAKLLLATEYRDLYVLLGLAKYGSKQAKKDIIRYDKEGVFEGKVPPGILKKYFGEIGISSVLNNPDELYKRGLAYYVGDKTGTECFSQGLQYIQAASDAGSPAARFVQLSDQKHIYIYLEAAKSGSERAKEKVLLWMKNGVLEKQIPEAARQQYLSEIEKLSAPNHPEYEQELTKPKLETPAVKPRPPEKSVRKKNPEIEKIFLRGLENYTGVHGNSLVNQGLDELLAAKDAGYPEAKEIFAVSRYSHRRIYFSAAKHGIIPARKQIEKWRESGVLSDEVLESELREYDRIAKTLPLLPVDKEERKPVRAVPEKPAQKKTPAAKPVPKESTPKPAPKKPTKKTKLVIDKDRLQEVKAEHLYTQNRLAIDYGEEEPVVKPVSIPVKEKTPVGDEADGEWGQMKSSLSKTHIRILKAILKEPGNVTKQHEIAKENGSMLDILYDEINEISDEILGDLLISDGEITEEYLDEVKNLCR